eukprot:GEMP01107500.1.p1 GENE.GEMP01107500.1~~GEMP01107500.1.p1  ORF type:complete len:151 (-),score=0.41 GEMP01107500.1:128-580(-)
MRATTKISQHKSVSLHVYIFYTLCDKQKKGLFWLFCSAQPPENKLPTELSYETLHLKASRLAYPIATVGRAGKSSKYMPPPVLRPQQQKGLDAQQVNSNIYTHARARQRELQADLFHALITVAGWARTQLIFVMHFWRVLSTHDAPIPLP